MKLSKNNFLSHVIWQHYGNRKGAADKILDHMVILRINSVSVFL